MKLFVEKRDGPGRLGTLKIKEKISFPNIFFIDTERFKKPNFSEGEITFDKKDQKPKIIFSDKDKLTIERNIFLPECLPKNVYLSFLEKKDNIIIPGKKELIDKLLKDNKSDFIVVSYAKQLLKHPKKFVDFIINLKERAGYNKIIYLPAVGDVSSFSLFIYMGVDFIDSTQAIIQARNNNLIFTEGVFNKNDLPSYICSCPACASKDFKTKKMGFKEILDHNYYIIYNELQKIRNAIKQGTLRELVEKRVKISPHLTSIFRYLDYNYYDFLEMRTSTNLEKTLFSTSKENMNHPIIKRFQKRVLTRYKKPKNKKILLLLPCSAKKPYSFSKSHKKIIRQIKSCKNSSIIHELIITSPIGIVPRELELVPPACCYDIPVTGVWDEDEKKMIRNLLKKYLEKNRYDLIISHLPPEINDFIDDIIPKSIITCFDKPTSEESLSKLQNILQESTIKYKKIRTNRKKEISESIACFQFGLETGKKLLSDTKVRGKYPNLKIFENKTQLGMIVGDRGFISLTSEGGDKIKNMKKYWVDISSDFVLKGSVFSPGIKDADKKIRIDDEVIVIRKNDLCAVGVALMNGDEMKNSLYGEAVKTRHVI